MTHLTYGEQRSAAEKIADAAVKERVLRGLEALQKVYGEDWVEYIDPATLTMSSSSQCILGQLAAKHPNGMGRAGISCADYDEEAPALAERLGVETDGDIGGDYGFNALGIVGYNALEEAWLQVIGAE